MGGFSLSTAVEIFSNPYDLYIRITRAPSSTDHAFLISRGPGHEFKPLLASNYLPLEKRATIHEVGNILESVRLNVTSELANPQSVLNRIMNPEGKTFNRNRVLTKKLISRIVANLERRSATSTYKYPRRAHKKR